MGSKIMVTIPCQFKLKLEQMSCLSVGQALCEFFRQEAFRKFQIHQNFLQAWPWAFSKKKKHAAELPVSQGTETIEDATRARFVLVVSFRFLISMVQLVQEDATHIPYTLYTRIHIQQWKRLGGSEQKKSSLPPKEIKRAVLLGSLLQTTRKVKRKWRKSRACCFVWENVPFSSCRLFTTSCFDFSILFESCWSKNCTNLLSSIHDQSARARLLAWFDLQNATS